MVVNVVVVSRFCDPISAIEVYLVRFDVCWSKITCEVILFYVLFALVKRFLNRNDSSCFRSFKTLLDDHIETLSQRLSRWLFISLSLKTGSRPARIKGLRRNLK